MDPDLWAFSTGVSLEAAANQSEGHKQHVEHPKQFHGRLDFPTLHNPAPFFTLLPKSGHRVIIYRG